MKITIERDGKLYSVPKFSVDIGFNYINIETKYMELIETKPLVENALPFDRSSEYKGYKMKIEETKPEEKPQFDDSQLLIGRNTYNPFTNECKEIPEEKYPLKSYKVEKDLSLTEIPTYWYIETSEMKKSEYWEVFYKWFEKTSEDEWEFSDNFYGYTGEGFISYDFEEHFGISNQLSPQQWYDTIYDGEKPCQHESDGQVYLSNPVQYKCKKCGKFYRNGICENQFVTNDGLPITQGSEVHIFTQPDHDKAIEIPVEVPEYDDVKFSTGDKWEKSITSAIQQLQRIVFKAHNNK